MTPTLSFSSSATNNRCLRKSTAIWSSLPRMSPSWILFSKIKADWARPGLAPRSRAPASREGTIKRMEPDLIEFLAQHDQEAHRQWYEPVALDLRQYYAR